MKNSLSEAALIVCRVFFFDLVVPGFSNDGAVKAAMILRLSVMGRKFESVSWTPALHRENA